MKNRNKTAQQCLLEVKNIPPKSKNRTIHAPPGTLRAPISRFSHQMKTSEEKSRKTTSTNEGRHLEFSKKQLNYVAAKVEKRPSHPGSLSEIPGSK